MSDELTIEQRMQVARTQSHVCARCGQSVDLHDSTKGTCPDGEGSYTWAMDGETRDRVIANLEAALAAPKTKLTGDQQKLLDWIAEAVLAGKVVRGADAPAALGWTPEYTGQIASELRALGMIE